MIALVLVALAALAGALLPRALGLLAHSDRDRSYSYDFQKHPFEGVENYVATIHVLPLTETNQSFVEWWTTFDCPPDKIGYWEDFYATQVFKGALEALKAYLPT